MVFAKKQVPSVRKNARLRGFNYAKGAVTANM
jgi:hypothetical protein